MKNNHTVENKFNQKALKLIEQISSQGLLATPIIYEAFFDAYCQNNMELKALLNRLEGQTQEKIEKNIRDYLSSQSIKNQNILAISREYSDAADKFIEQSVIQNERYRDDISRIFNKNRDIEQNLEAFNDNKKGYFQHNIDDLESSRLFFEPQIIAYEDVIKALKNRLNDATARATQDFLTEVNNRREFERRFNIYLNQSKEKQTTLCLAIFDIDHFKHFNDKYGHDIGDQVLKHFALLLKKQVREEDAVFRYGGEEFTVLFPNTNLEQAVAIAERIRKKVASKSLNQRSKSLPVDKLTVSCGISVSKLNDDEQSLFKRADNNLYKAKNSGRNQVQFDVFQD